MDLGVRANLANWAGEAFLFGSVGSNPAITPGFKNNEPHVLGEELEVLQGCSEFGLGVREVKTGR